MAAEHEGAHEGWSPRAELAEVGQSPDMRHATEPEAAAALRADLAAWEVRTKDALADVVARALAQLGQVSP
jgi:hypothetical protein